MKEQQKSQKLSKEKFVNAAGIVSIGLVALAFFFNPLSAMAQQVFKVIAPHGPFPTQYEECQKLLDLGLPLPSFFPLPLTFFSSMVWLWA